MRIVRTPTSFSAGWLLTAFLLGLTGPAHAGDGVIEINQAKAEAGGVTPGDTEGFPVTISEPGSYRLTGNLTVPDENTNAIDVSADDVTVDLNGFAIVGPTVCTGTPVTSCSPTGTGEGISSVSENTTVLNGTVRGMGSSGVFIAGRVERVRAVSNGLHGIQFFGSVNPPGIAVGNWAIGNGGDGIDVINGGVVTDNVAKSNGGDGISAGPDSTVTGNTANSNGARGIRVNRRGTVTANTANFNVGTGISLSEGGTVTGNTAMNNGIDGISDFSGVGITVTGNTVANNSGFGLILSVGGYANNVINGNTAGTVSVSAVEMGTNVCNGNTTCP